MGWNTDQLKFEKIKLHLQEIHKETWNDSLVVVGDERTDDAFLEARYIFLSETFEEVHDYNMQMDYLRSLKKPGDMQIKTFLQYLRIANKQVVMIPGAPGDAGLSESEMKKIFYMPCQNSGRSTIKMQENAIKMIPLLG